jgi:hypothetical protein
MIGIGLEGVVPLEVIRGRDVQNPENHPLYVLARERGGGTFEDVVGGDIPVDWVSPE